MLVDAVRMLLMLLDAHRVRAARARRATRADNCHPALRSHRVRTSMLVAAVRMLVTLLDAHRVRSALARRAACADDCHPASRSHRASVLTYYTSFIGADLIFSGVPQAILFRSACGANVES